MSHYCLLRVQWGPDESSAAWLGIETFISIRSIFLLSHLHFSAASQRCKLEQLMANRVTRRSRTSALLSSLHLFTTAEHNMDFYFNALI